MKTARFTNRVPTKRPFLCLAAVYLALSFSAMAADSAALDQAFAGLAKIQYGDDRTPLHPIETAIAEARRDEALRSQLEQRLIAVLESAAPDAAKDFSCRSLKLIGTTNAVPALAALLSNAKLAGQARDALERIPGPAVDQALRQALASLNGKLKIGVITSLGYRHATGAVDTLAGLLSEPDAQVATAAAHALADIATPEAARALLAWQPQAPEPLRPAADQAAIEVANARLRVGDKALAARLFRGVSERNAAGYLHLAAFQGLVAAEPGQAVKRLLAALAGDNEVQRNLAGQLWLRMIEIRITPEILERLADLPAAGQVVFLRVLQERRLTSARPAVLRLLNSPAPRVRSAAIDTLAVIGAPEDVPALARLAAQFQGKEKDAARQALAQLRGAAVDAAIVEAMRAAESPVLVELLHGLAARQATTGVEAVTNLLADADPAVVHEAIATLGAIGGTNAIPVLAGRLTPDTPASERQTIAEALETIGARLKTAAVASLLAALAEGPPESQVVLLGVLGNIGGTRALRAVRTAIKDDHPQVQEAAIRALAYWADIAAANDILEVVTNTVNPSLRTLAFRGYVRLARTSTRARYNKLNMLSRAMQLAQDANEKKLVLSALNDLRTLGSLRLAQQSLADPELADEAGMAVLRIVPGLTNKSNHAAIRAALEQVVRSAKAKTIVNAARNQLRRLPR